MDSRWLGQGARRGGKDAQYGSTKLSALSDLLRELI